MKHDNNHSNNNNDDDENNKLEKRNSQVPLKNGPTDHKLIRSSGFCIAMDLPLLSSPPKHPV